MITVRVQEEHYKKLKAQAWKNHRSVIKQLAAILEAEYGPKG